MGDSRSNGLRSFGLTVAAVLAAISMIAVMALMTNSSASAGETSDSASFGPAAAPFSDTAELSQCDPANGELLSVEITSTADVTANYTLQSGSDVPQDATVDAQLALTLDGPGLTNPLVVDVGITEIVPIAAGELIMDSATASDSGSVTVTGADLAPFIGTGTLLYTVDATGVVTTSFSNGNGFGGGTNEVKAAVLTVTCIFEDAPPPPPANPGVSLEKSTNGEDADDAPGVALVAGDAVTWTYDVVNTGDVDLTNVVITDDIIGDICVIDSLPVGASDSCSAQGVAVEGPYTNLGSVTADGGDAGTVSDSDPSNYTARGLVPSIAIDKTTNGSDAPEGLVEGDPVTWTYVVTNDGETVLENVTVNDDIEGPVPCPQTTLAVGESMTCELSGYATVGDYANTGTAAGVDPANPGAPVDAVDPSGYTAIAAGGTGTIGYWKTHSSCYRARGNGLDPVLDETIADAGGAIAMSSTFSVSTCEDAVALLNKTTIDTGKKRASDPVFNMAAQYLGALLNLENDAHRCPELFAALADAEAVFEAVGFDGTGSYLDADPAVLAEANRLNELLDAYNNGGVCPDNYHR